jgi:vitamin B12 transporter
MIDGVPLTKQDATGTVSLEHIMLDQIERVEIVRGNVSAIYGSGAVGGVIQLFTRKGQGKPAGYAPPVSAGRSATPALPSVSVATGPPAFRPLTSRSIPMRTRMTTVTATPTST